MFQVLWREGPVPFISGSGNKGALERGEVGSFDADPKTITCAVPSLRTRKDHDSSMRHFKLGQGYIFPHKKCFFSFFHRIECNCS